MSDDGHLRFLRRRHGSGAGQARPARHHHVPQHPHPVQFRAAGDRGRDPRSSLQFVRKLSGFAHPSKANKSRSPARSTRSRCRAAELIESLVTTADPRDRDIEAARAKHGPPSVSRRVEPQPAPAGSVVRYRRACTSSSSSRRGNGITSLTATKGSRRATLAASPWRRPAPPRHGGGRDRGLPTLRIARPLARRECLLMELATIDRFIPGFGAMPGASQ